MWKWKSRPKTPFFSEEQIRAKAYELWQERGDESSDENNWNDAIRFLKRKRSIKRTFRPIQQLWWWVGVGKPVRQAWQWTGIPEKKGWDYMQLLLVPALLAIGGFWLNQQTAQRQDNLNQQRHDQDQKLADEKAKQDALVKYLDQMADSLKDKLLGAKPGSEEFIIAQSRTVTVLQSLDKNRQHLVIQFLRASGLSKTDPNTNPEKLTDRDRVLLYQAQMEKAHFSESDLSGAVLIKANLRSANFGCNPSESKEPNQCSDLSLTDFRSADLRSANLSSANLSSANLSSAFLYGAFLGNADLFGANLSGAFLNGAHLNSAFLLSANLSGANLNNVDLSGANLRGANLNNADLSGANLRGAKNLSDQQLEAAKLCKTILPEDKQFNPNRDCKKLGIEN